MSSLDEHLLLLSCMNYPTAPSLARPSKLPVGSWDRAVIQPGSQTSNRRKKMLKVSEGVARVGGEMQGGQKDRDGGNSWGS